MTNWSKKARHYGEIQESRGSRERTGEKLENYKSQSDVVVLGLPRGGMPLAEKIARAIGAPLGVVVVRKLGVPGHEELAMGAIGSGGVRIMNDEVVRSMNVSEEQIDEVAREEEKNEESVRRNTAGRGPTLTCREKPSSWSMTAAPQAPP